jgi:hypothetical protein
VIFSPSRPVTIVPCPDGDVMLLPAMWPVRLTPEQRRALAVDLLSFDESETAGNS